MNSAKPRALLFDLGGVLIDIDFERALRAWAPMSRLSLAQLRESFHHDEYYERHERGEISAREYFAHLAQTLQLAGDPGQIAAGWNAIFPGEIPETTAMVRAARAELPCYLFTNTNAAHQEIWAALFPEVPRLFERIFASHEMGRRKPEIRAFEHVAREIGVTPGSILFFDDLLANVEGARAAGLQAVLVRSPQDVREALHKIGCKPGLVPPNVPG